MRRGGFVEGDFGGSTGFDDETARGVGKDAVTVSSGWLVDTFCVWLALRLRKEIQPIGKVRTYWPAAA